MQYQGYGWVPYLITITFCLFILLNIWRAKRSGGNLFIRRIAGLNAIDDAVGRATEMGRPVLMVPGLGGLNAIAVQALNVFQYVTGICIKFATPIRVCCGEPAVFTVAQEVIRDVYMREGAMDRYQNDYVQFLSNQQFAFAAGVSGLIRREKVAAAFLLGEFFAESLIFAESANAMGAIQVAGTTSTTQTPFFIASCDYVLIGDEYYAASAYLSREPILVGSLVGQDWAKIASALLVIAGSLLTSWEVREKKPSDPGPNGEQPQWINNGKADFTMTKYLSPDAMTPEEVEVWKERNPRQKETAEATK
ncbi:MAG: hypothetical protein JNJ45_06965 [Chthonomonas sp.]|nr:hypothetical protein [Chthonomonas sp.]